MSYLTIFDQTSLATAAVNTKFPLANNLLLMTNVMHFTGSICRFYSHCPHYPCAIPAHRGILCIVLVTHTLSDAPIRIF